jgi:hypothetical protein
MWNISVSAVGRVVCALARLWAVRLRNSCSIPEKGQEIFLLSKASKLGLGTNKFSYRVGPCHHGLARPQVADRRTASSMEGSCEYIE